MTEWVTLEEGIEDLAPNRKRYDTLGFYPRRYWLIGEMEEGEDSTPPGGVSVHIDEEARPRVSNCARCQREIKPQYTFCYRCHNYLQVKARIA